MKLKQLKTFSEKGIPVSFCVCSGRLEDWLLGVFDKASSVEKFSDYFHTREFSFDVKQFFEKNCDQIISEIPAFLDYLKDMPDSSVNIAIMFHRTK